MNEGEIDTMRKRIAALEARVAELEKKIDVRQGNVEMIVRRFPEFMDKTRAAEALGVTRATIYAMLADGRLQQNAMGKVLTSSVASMVRPGKPSKSAYKRKGQEALRMGADN